MDVYSVSEVTTYLRELLETNPHLADLWISGEVSNLSRSPAGHVYFTLKDETAQLRCVFFRRPNMGAPLDQGMQVVAHGRVSLYEVRGELQFYVDFVQPEGVGVLHAQFERLKAQLEEEGLFDEARKRPLPRFPCRIGVVTSPVGAVFHDICNILGRRWPLAEVVLAPTAVQGPEAASGVVSALTALNDEGAIEVIIVARGGGSLEELWAFNEEPVARAIYGSRVPVISAIGHETDYTIADFVGDLRAPTPSAAAELVAPDRLEVTVRLSVLAASLLTSCRGEVEGRRAGLSQVVGRMERLIPDLARERQRVDDLWRQGNASLEAVLRRWRESLSGFAGQLRSLDPKATLARGYALVQRDGHVVSSVAEVTGGERLSVRVKDGGIPVRVEKAAGTRLSGPPVRQAGRQARKGEKRGEGVQPLLMVDP
jgi:exodeoxyribonuclease VII large subunit